MNINEEAFSILSSAHFFLVQRVINFNYICNLISLCCEITQLQVCGLGQGYLCRIIILPQDSGLTAQHFFKDSFFENTDTERGASGRSQMRDLGFINTITF